MQTVVRSQSRTMAEIAEDTPVNLTISMSPAVARQVAQFVKRSTFDTFFNFTEADLPHDERKALAYQMIAGIEAVGVALGEAGYAPR